MSVDPEVATLLDTTSHLLGALRRLHTLTERLLDAAMSTEPLTAEHVVAARSELDAARTGMDKFDAMLALRRQDLRPQ
jgi:hypothetical protein